MRLGEPSGALESGNWIQCMRFVCDDYVISVSCCRELICANPGDHPLPSSVYWARFRCNRSRLVGIEAFDASWRKAIRAGAEFSSIIYSSQVVVRNWRKHAAEAVWISSLSFSVQPLSSSKWQLGNRADVWVLLVWKASCQNDTSQTVSIKRACCIANRVFWFAALKTASSWNFSLERFCDDHRGEFESLLLSVKFFY